MMDATKVQSTLSTTFQSAELCITDILTGVETTVALLEQFRQEKGPQDKKFKEGYCGETGILQEEPLSYFKVFDSTKEMPQEHSHLATYGNHEVKSLVEHFRSNYLTEHEETSIIVQWPALCTRPVRQKAITPNHVFSNLLASRPDDIKDCVIVLGLMLTLSPSAAKCKQGFSAMTHLECNLPITLWFTRLNFGSEHPVRLHAHALFRPDHTMKAYRLNSVASNWFSGARTKRHIQKIFKLTTGIPKLSANLLTTFIPGTLFKLAVQTRN